MRFAFVLVLAASAAFGQVTQIFQLTQHETRQDLEGIAIAIRTMGDIQQVAVDDQAVTVNVAGTDGQLAMAGWLIYQLDVPARRRLSGMRDENITRVFFLAGAPTAAQLHRTFNLVRSTTRAYRSFIYTAPGALVVRGTAGEVATAEKTIEEMKAQ